MSSPIDQTIQLLSKDTLANSPKRIIITALLLLIPVSIGLTWIVSIVTSMPLRPDYLDVIIQPFVLAKQLIPALIVATLIPILCIAFCPTADFKSWLILPICAAGLVDVLIIIELIQQPAKTWEPLVIGKTIKQCLFGISLIASGTLCAGIVCLRKGAVTRPILCGFLLGITAGAFGALLYAFLCFQDSPLFYGVWYSLATLSVGGIGAILGHKCLRW